MDFDETNFIKSNCECLQFLLMQIETEYCIVFCCFFFKYFPRLMQYVFFLTFNFVGNGSHSQTHFYHHNGQKQSVCSIFNQIIWQNLQNSTCKVTNKKLLISIFDYVIYKKSLFNKNFDAKMKIVLVSTLWEILHNDLMRTGGKLWMLPEAWTQWAVAPE